MGRDRIPARFVGKSLPTKGTPYLNGSVYYRAEIRRCGRVVTKLPGRYNIRETLDGFLSAHWAMPLERKTVEAWEVPLELKVWQYFGHGVNSVTSIIRPEVVWADDTEEFTRLMHEVEVSSSFVRF